MTHTPSAKRLTRNRGAKKCPPLRALEELWNAEVQTYVKAAHLMQISPRNERLGEEAEARGGPDCLRRIDKVKCRRCWSGGSNQSLVRQNREAVWKQDSRMFLTNCVCLCRETDTMSVQWKALALHADVYVLLMRPYLIGNELSTLASGVRSFLWIRAQAQCFMEIFYHLCYIALTPTVMSRRVEISILFEKP